MSVLGLAAPLRRAAALHGRSTAVVDAGRTLTYAELERRVGALGAALDALEVPAGGRVGVLAANGLAHLECFLGVPAAGRVVVSLNFRLGPDELVALAQDAGLRVLVCDPERLAAARGLAASCPTVEHLVLDGPPAAGCSTYEDLLARDPAPPRPAGGDEPAALSYTGGTTGRPKGVVLTHANLLANAQHNLIATGHAHGDRWLHVCPMFHVAGTANVLAATWAGAEQVLLPRFDAAGVLAAVHGHRITHLALVPTMVAMLLEEDAARPADLSSLRHVQYAASPIAPRVQRRLLERVDCDVAQFYGMTEAAPTVTHCTPEDHRRGLAGEEPWATRLASMGAPVVGVEVELRDPAGGPVAVGDAGEVWLRGANVMAGYLGQPEATAAALVDGWYRTGDAARADADGYLYVVDRLKDMIITGGENVYSVEVEHVLEGHPSVLEAAVFAVPDARWGEAVHAVVALAPGADATSEELVAHCRTRLGGFKVPRRVDVSAAPLPKSGAGKLLKHLLRAPHWTDQGRAVG